MADNYIFEEANTNSEKVREALEQGTDANGRSILRNVTQSKVADGDNAALGSTGDASDQDTSTNGTLLGYVQGAVDYLGSILSPISSAFDGSNAFSVSGTDGSNPKEFLLDQSGRMRLAELAGIARTSEPGAVGDGTRIEAFLDEHGRQVVRDDALNESVPSSAFKDTALSNSVSQVKGSAGEVVGYHITNPNSSFAYVKFYDNSGSTVGTTTPIATMGIPPETGATTEHIPIEFTTAIEVAATTGQSDGDSTAPSTGLVANIFYR
jgi:hypothetical protein